jgi:DNA-binding beta-propeller fold protein YncE
MLRMTPHPCKAFLRAGLLLGFALAAIAPQSSRAADATAPHIGEGGVPQFEREANWAKVPAAWTHGAVGTSVAVDENNHIWMLSRPNALKLGGDVTKTLLGGGKPQDLPASAIPGSVIEFDETGKVVQDWSSKGGKGFVWPSNEHGIGLGPKGSLLFLGFKNGAMNQETQLLRFSKNGKFISSIGKPDEPGSNKAESLNGPTAAFYFDKTNEYFVADGYGNNRVVVFDADTGKMKRMWSAYGRKPLDKAERTERTRPALLMPSGKPWVPLTEQMQQFQEPHDIRVAKDGLVYVADRGNRRVQVFTTEGKFVAEQFVGLDSKYEMQAINLDFSPDQRFLYVGGTPVVYILNRHTLEVLGTIPIDSDVLSHHMAVDKMGNIYIARTKNSDLDGKPFGVGIQKYAFKGYSPSTKCCQGVEKPAE